MIQVLPLANQRIFKIICIPSNKTSIIQEKSPSKDGLGYGKVTLHLNLNSFDLIRALEEK